MDLTTLVCARSLMYFEENALFLVYPWEKFTYLQDYDWMPCAELIMDILYCLVTGKHSIDCENVNKSVLFVSSLPFWRKKNLLSFLVKNVKGIVYECVLFYINQGKFGSKKTVLLSTLKESKKEFEKYYKVFNKSTKSEIKINLTKSMVYLDKVYVENSQLPKLWFLNYYLGSQKQLTESFFN